MAAAEMWPLPTGRTVNEVLDSFAGVLVDVGGWSAIADSIDPDDPVETVNAVAAASILLDKIARGIANAQRYAVRLEGYRHRGVVAAGFVSADDMSSEIAAQRHEEQRLRELADDVDRWTRSMATACAAAWSRIETTLSALAASDWAPRGQPIVPMWWPRGALRPSDAQLYSSDEWTAMAEALMRRSIQHGASTTVEAAALQEQLAVRRGASLHTSWL